jgi:hypothetical protein
MSIAILTSHAEGLGINGGTTSSIDTIGASTILVVLAWQGGGTLSDSQGNSWTALTLQGSGPPYSRIFYCDAPKTSATHTFTLTGTYLYASIGILVLSGTATSSFDVENGASGNGTTLQTGSVNPSEDGEIIVTTLAVDAGTTESIDSNFVIEASTDFSSGQYYHLVLAYKIQTSKNAENPIWSNFGGPADCRTAIATFKAAISAGAPPIPAKIIPGVSVWQSVY